MKICSLVVFLLLQVTWVYGQNRNSYIQVGISPVAYRGDLGNGFSKWRMNVNLGLLFNKKDRVNGSAQIAIGSVTGQSDDREIGGSPDITPNSYFKTNFVAVNYELHYNIIRNEFLKFYIGQGFGFMHFTPKDQYGENLREQYETREEGESYGSIAVIFPTKLGAIYFLPNDFGLGFETGLYNSLTDYIDNISAWGDKGGLDNMWYFKFSLSIPVNL